MYTSDFIAHFQAINLATHFIIGATGMPLLFASLLLIVYQRFLVSRLENVLIPSWYTFHIDRLWCLPMSKISIPSWK